jgi:hypothetical protein
VDFWVLGLLHVWRQLEGQLFHFWFCNMFSLLLTIKTSVSTFGSFLGV